MVARLYTHDFTATLQTHVAMKRVEIHLAEHRSSVFDRPPRYDRQIPDLRRGVRPAVRLDHADHDIG